MIFRTGGASWTFPSIPVCPGICGTISTTLSSSATYKDVTTGLVAASVGFAVQLTVMVCRSSSGFSSSVSVSFRLGPMLPSRIVMGRPQVPGKQYILPVELVAHGLGSGEVVLPEPQG